MTDRRTIADLWATLGASTDADWLAWPPDVFALTDVVIDHTEIYRFVVSPPAGASWPPTPAWAEAVVAAGQAWTPWSRERVGAPPALVGDAWATVQERATTTLDDLAEGRDWELAAALFTLHAAADEACAGMGAAVDRAGVGAAARARAGELLARTGSLSRLARPGPRVLPKVRTPAGGISMRSLSRYVCARTDGVEVTWNKVPGRRRDDPLDQSTNMLLLPWPLRLTPRDFRPLSGSIQRPAVEPFGFFAYEPHEPFDLDVVDRLIVAGIEDAGSVDVVMLPEGAVPPADIPALEDVLARRGVVALVAGVRDEPGADGMAPNWVHISAFTKGRWWHYRQNKHHRWSLEESQIRQYHLGGVLHPRTRWWEAMAVPRRSIQFVEVAGGITMVALVCEDLARLDDVADLVRSVGPTLVVTVLLDGPQLASRWTARYAGVLADDPGSAVLTLTAFGMVDRSRPDGIPPSRVVALWKDPQRGARELTLEPGAQGVLVTTVVDRVARHCADGRSPALDTVHLLDVAAHAVRAEALPDGVRPAAGGPLVEPPLVGDLDTTELTIWSCWAAAADEPDDRTAVGADIAPDAKWRAAWGLEPPSPSLSKLLRALVDDGARTEPRSAVAD